MLLMSEDSFIDDSANSLESSSTSSNSAPSDTSEDDDDDDDGVADADDIVGKKKTKIDENGDDDVDQKTKENNNNSTVNKKSLSRRRRRLRRPLTRQEAKNPTTVILDSDSNDDDDDDDDDDDSDSVTDIDGSQKPWWYQFYKDEYDWQINVGAKMDVLFNILKRCSDIGDKVILFSHSLISLDLIEKFLAEISRQWSVLQNQSSDQKTEENVENAENADTLNRPDLSSYFSDIGHNTWIRGLDYERMDGSMNVNVRKDLQARFNSTSNTRLRLFIISTKAGGLGINLIAANRLVLLDASWNPSHDIQSIFRSYRFGQHKPVYIYRLIAQGTIEEKIYDRQVTKQSLSLRVVDELQIDRHFSDDDLQKLFTFEPDIWNPEDDNDSDKRPTPILPKDRLLADMLTEYRHLIATYHNHDSLLQHREDEGLTEVERQEAWREYEEEKQYGMSLAEHQRLVMLQQQWIAQQQQQIQQQQQLFHLQYLQQQQQQQYHHQQQQQHQLQHFILPNFQFPTVSSPNTSGQTIVISDDNSNHSNNDSQVMTSPPVVHSGNVVVPNKNTKKNNTKNTNTAVTNPGSPTMAMAMATTAASANNSTRNTTDLHHSAGSQLITDISTTTKQQQHWEQIQQARYITPAINNLPSNAYGRMYSQVRRGAILKDPSLISDPEKLDKLTMNKLVSVLTTPVLVNTDDVHDPSSFTMMRSSSKASHNPQSKN
ncbi:unnamed protein product [Trichobilharzia szidati]|nr:unnamed protein product [Trichobilharzia szidati]